MPVWFQGIAQEHEAVRTRPACSTSRTWARWKWRVRRRSFLDLMTVNYVAMLRIGQAHYSYLLDPDGHVIDDILVYRRGEETFFVVVNANAEEDEAWLRAAASGKFLLDRKDPGIEPPKRLRVRNLKGPIQRRRPPRGPRAAGTRVAPTILALAGPGKFAGRIERLGRFEFSEGLLDGVPTLVSRTGYTGEDIGFEIYLHPTRRRASGTFCSRRGGPLGVVPAGLGARDSTRTEAGLPLHGTSWRAGTGESGRGGLRLVRPAAPKPFFVGRERMVDVATHPRRVIVRFRVPRGGRQDDPSGERRGRRAARRHFAGTVTSCTAVQGFQVGWRWSIPPWPLRAPASRSSPCRTGTRCRRARRWRAGPGTVVVPREAVVVTRFAARDPVTGCRTTGSPA